MGGKSKEKYQYFCTIFSAHMANMRKTPLLLVISLSILIISSCGNKRSGTPRVLVFSKTTGFRHSSIEPGKIALIKLGQENGLSVDTTENAAYFNEDSLKNYSAVVFLNATDNTDDILNNYQQNAFERYIQAGGGFVGIHAASDAGYQWGWYERLVGANFESHPSQQEATLNIIDKNHPSTKHLPDQWKRKDEWYNFKKLNKEVKVLLTIDEKSYEGGKNGDFHPMAWYHDYDGGRAFYTELGHSEESYSEENFLKHILGGIQYAIGDNKNLDYTKVKTPLAPDEDRFTKRTLIQGQFFEPTEMTILPNHDILISQRRGEIMLYKSKDSTLKQVALLPTYWKTSVPKVNAEEGVLGIKIDPDFAKNHYVYIFYSPLDTSVNRLSRFTLENDTLSPASEKIVLQFYSQREICCHTGGSVAFGKDRMLFVSAGDNSTPFNEPGQTYVNRGYGPLDDRPGHQQYDARRSSGNTNDLRGKILRIHMKEDGTYDIPEGNLFKPGQAKTRPEIYVMGNRNPYRISVDQLTGFLYWGEVGPDASNDSLETRGSRGYDELNQARKAGYFGWPFFVGNNYPYRAYNYATGQSGDLFNPEKPINNSRNNTGLTELPPVAPAFIYYPYAASKEFPQVGTGGRNAMAGPVYYTSLFPEATRLPEYYNGKLFIYDWIRGWIKAVTMLPNGDFDKMEPFMEHTKLSAAIDIELGADGRMYILEYGSGWFAKNADAGLSVIEYNSGNRAPKVVSLNVNKTSGTLPFAIHASVVAKDPEGGTLSYVWNLGNGDTKTTTIPELDYTFDKAGEFSVSVAVSDPEKASSKSSEIVVYSGNEVPVVSLHTAVNRSFYFAGKPVQYDVTVTDKDDTAAIDKANLFLSAQYVVGKDKAATMIGHQVISDATMGKNLMLSLDCKTCHQIDTKSIGPAYTEVSKKYAKDNNTIAYLANKIIKGGSGVWGETNMPAHPGLTEADASKIAGWVVSLKDEGKTVKSLPPSGSLNASMNQPVKEDGYLYISASYTDKGKPGIKPLSGHSDIVLRNSLVNFDNIEHMEDYTDVDRDGATLLIVPKREGWFSIDSIDLSGITDIQLKALWKDTLQFGYTFELALDNAEGAKIAEAVLPASKAQKLQETILTFRPEAVTDGRLHTLYVRSRQNDSKEMNSVGLRFLKFNTK